MSPPSSLARPSFPISISLPSSLARPSFPCSFPVLSFPVPSPFSFPSCAKEWAHSHIPPPNSALSPVSFPSTTGPTLQFAIFMEDTLLEAIYDDEALDFEDVEMVDVEDGQELPEHAEVVTGTAEGDDSLLGKTEDVKMVSKKRRRKKSRKKDKSLNGARKDDSTYMDSFVLETSRRLNEKKIHLVREAVNYLGLAAVNDLVAEVDTVQKCGGQMTLDGTRPRTGGGILWNILRLRDRKAYREIMSRGKKFMRQRKQVLVDKLQKEPVETPHSSDMATSECLKNSSTAEPVQDELSKHDSPQNRVSVWHRVRVPVSYGDLVDDGTEEGEITE
ncbi:hypothetical protein EJ110_NYTH56129 [Nymphaea thermarum]|nr:hypothetical protein EJ110_NYTH56129 [Nymphaea thermarum]